MEQSTNYEKLKKWCAAHKKEITVGACFALIFLVGFGTGKFNKELQKSVRRSADGNQKYYNKPAGIGQTPGNLPQAAGETLTTNTKPGNNQTTETNGQSAKDLAIKGLCAVKGNISAKGNKIYHVKGGAFYDRTTPEQCFKTEQEAQAAGFRKSSR